MKDFLDVVKSRKSIRSFKPDSVDPKLIETILEVATYAPTNCNQQLWNFVVVTDPQVKERLIKEAASNTMLRRAPVVVVVTYDGWNYKEAIQGGALAVGHIVLAATYFGVGSLPMNSYGADTKVKKILRIPDKEVICCFVLLGYPDEKATFALPVARRPLQDVLHHDYFRNKRLLPYSYDPDDWSLEDLRAHQSYYCRKTFMGKEMDIMSVYERELVRRELASLSGPVVDLMTYDGAYLREFPDSVALTTVDLTPETADYTKVAVGEKQITATVFSPDKEIPQAPVSTLIYKLERLPKALRRELFQKTTGELIIIARKSNWLLSVFFFTIKLLFGPDVRKTGIYTFFGPYRPIRLSEILVELRGAGFNVEWNGYFLIPSFFEQAYQMLLQYIASEGSSYLHREKRENWISRFLSRVFAWQGFRPVGRLGSVTVIRCQK